MFSRSAVRTLTQSRQFSSSAARQTKVAVLGAGGGIGQPLSLLLKQNKLVTSLSLYDIRGAPGVAADVSHIDSPSVVRAQLVSTRVKSLNVVRFRSRATPRTSSTRPLRVSRSLSSPPVFPVRYVISPIE